MGKLPDGLLGEFVAGVAMLGAAGRRTREALTHRMLALGAGGVADEKLG